MKYITNKMSFIGRNEGKEKRNLRDLAEFNSVNPVNMTILIVIFRL